MIVIASRNPGKISEIIALPEAAGLNLIPITDYAECPDVVEDGTSFEENAAIKAVRYSLWLKRRHGIWPPVVAEDSGLAIEALLGWPGVRSARLAPTNDERIQTVLERVSDLTLRSARFIAVTALALNGTLLKTHTAYVQGNIAAVPRGSSGFGYDPIFEDPATGSTFAELKSTEKNALSHRAKAWGSTLTYIRQSSYLSQVLID